MSAAETDWLGDVAPPPANPGGRPRKSQTGRMRKVHCEACGCIVYASAKALQLSGLPVCGCGEPMALANLRDRAVVEWDALEVELAALGRDAYNAAMRELGYTGMVEVRTHPRRSGLAPARCQWQGGYCAKFVSGRYCPEHDPYQIAARSRRGA